MARLRSLLQSARIRESARLYEDTAKKRPPSRSAPAPADADDQAVLAGVAELLHAVRRLAARSANTIMTATYREIGRRIVEHEQQGKGRAGARPE